MGLFSKIFNPLTDLPDLSGKVIIVTGGNAGYATVKHLARNGAKVCMAARNKTRAEEPIAKLKQEGLGPGNDEVVWLKLDLIDPRNAKTSAHEFRSEEKHLDALVHNNVATSMETYQLTPDEPNSVGVVVVSSEAHKLVSDAVRFRNLDDFNDEFKDAFFPWFNCYAYSKLANIMYASELQRRLSAQGPPITVVSLNPTAVNTFSRKPLLKRISRLVDILVYPFCHHPDVGAYPSAFAAASSEVVQNPDKFKGAYLV